MAAEPRCIYCPGPSETLEHMPPRSMFQRKDRPSAMEFGACTACNGATRGADVVASVIARLHPDIPGASWQNAEIRRFIRALDAFAPGVREEMSRPRKHDRVGHRAGSGLCTRGSVLAGLDRRPIARKPIS